MDLPPPPPLPLFRHQHDHHLRYRNVLHPPDFIPPPYTNRLPPAPQPPPPHILLPPPPSPPTNILLYPLHSPRFTFSPPRHPIYDRPYVERPHHHEFDPPPKPYSHRSFPLPSSPPPPRENIRLRDIPDYTERNPMFKDEMFRRSCNDSYIHEIWDRDLNWGGSRDLLNKVPDTEDHERYCDINYQGRQLYKKMDNDGRIWDNRVKDRSRDLYNERDYEDRRRDSGRGHKLINKRDCDDRRLDNGMNARGCHLGNERDYDERGWDSGMNGRRCELYSKKEYDERRWDGVISNGGCELYTEGNDDERRLVDGNNDWVFLRSENRQPDLMQDDLGLRRFTGRLGRRVCEEKFLRPKKKRRLQKKNAIHRIQLEKECSRRSGAHKHQHFPKTSSSGSFRGKEKEGFECLQTIIKDKKEREQSPMELAISFKSNSLVAKAILAPSSPAAKSGINSMDVNNRTVCSMSHSQPIESSNDVVKTSCLSCDLDILSESKGTSENGSLTASGANDLGENSLKDEPPKDMDLQGPGILGSDSKSDSYKHSVPTAKRKRHSLTTLSASSHVADNVIIGCSGHAESLVITNGQVDHVCPLGTDEVGDHAHETHLADEDSGCGESLSFNQHTDIVEKLEQNGASVLHTDESAIWSIGRYTSLGSDRVDDNSVHSLQDGTDDDIFGSSRLQEARIPEVEEDKYFSKVHESNFKSDSRLLQNPKCAIISDMGSADPNSDELFPDQVNMLQVQADGEEVRSSDDAVRDCLNVGLGISTSANVLSTDNKGIVSRVEVSFPDALSEKPFVDIDSLEGCPEAISNVKTCSSMDYSSEISRKRKARGAHMGFASSSTNVLVGTDRSISGEVARLLANDLVTDLEVGFLVEKESCKEVSCLGPTKIEHTTVEVDYDANGSYPGCKKTRRVASPISNFSSLLEDDKGAAEVTSDCSELVLSSNELAEWGAKQREATPSAFASPRRGMNDVERTVGLENFHVADLDKNLGDISKLDVEGDLALIENNLFVCADRNDTSALSSGEDLLASSSEMQSCPSSPEELLSYSDFSFSRNVACQSGNDVVFERVNTSYRKPVVADPSTFSLGKSLVKAVSDNSQTNANLSPSVPKDSSEVVKKLNYAHGKPTVPKSFPDQHPLKFSNSRRFHSTHATKSRTWCRADNSVTVTEPKPQPSLLHPSHGTKIAARTMPNSYIRKGNSLVRNPSPSAFASPCFRGSHSSVYRLTHTDNMKNGQASDKKPGDAKVPTLLRLDQVNTSELPKAPGKLLCNSGKSTVLPPRNGKASEGLEESIKSSAVPECQTDLVNNSGSQGTLEEGNLEKKILYVKRRSNQLVAASSSLDKSALVIDKTQASLSDTYYKSRKNQLVRASSEKHVKEGDTNVNLRRLVPQTILPRTTNRRVSGFAKSCRNSKFSFVWKLHDTQSSEKHKNSLVPRKVWPLLFPSKRATTLKSFMHALGTKPNSSSFPATSQKLLLSRKRGAIYTRSTHGYSLRISKVLSVNGSSLKWSKSIERSSKKANEEATQAVAAAEKRKKEENGAVPIASKSRNHVPRKSVLSVKLCTGERIFRIGSERYKMDPTRRTLHRIAADAEKEPSSSVVLHSEKVVKRSYVPRRLLIGNEEYVRVGNGNQLVRDPKRRNRILASEKVRWSLRTARLRLARKRKYCQFFTRFGKCDKGDGKCPYIHDPSKIVVCTKFLSGSCLDPDCKLTHKVIPERMQDCSYFLKGSCSNESCPYRHVNVNPDWTVCKSFLRGYCADGNECQKKHTYVCPAFEATGICPQASTCKLHHPKKKIETKPKTEQKIVRGRYFDGGLIGVADCSLATPEKLPAKGKDDDIVCNEGKFPDYISLDVSDDEMEVEPTLASRGVCDDIPSDIEIAADIDEVIEPRMQIVYQIQSQPLTVRTG